MEFVRQNYLNFVQLYWNCKNNELCKIIQIYEARRVHKVRIDGA